MANRESAVLTSYDTLLSPPPVTEGRPTSVSSTLSGGSSRTTGTVSPSSTPFAKPRATRRRTIIFGTVCFRSYGFFMFDISIFSTYI